jgi:hypothetical protein
VAEDERAVRKDLRRLREAKPFWRD